MSDSNANGLVPHSEKQFLHVDLSRAFKLFNSGFELLDVPSPAPFFSLLPIWGGGKEHRTLLTPTCRMKNLHCVVPSSHGSEKAHLSFLFPDI